jgi:hypothetical protein
MDQATAERASLNLRNNTSERNGLEARVSLRHNRSRRIAWLIENRHLWRGLLTARAVANGRSERRWKVIVRLMQEEGLVQPSTHWSDVNLISLIVDARKQLRRRRVSIAADNGIQRSTCGPDTNRDELRSNG